MARARNIKPALFKNEVLGVADPLYTLLFEGLWLLADRAGRLEERPLRIKAEVFPYREGLDMEAMLHWLESSGFIRRYSVNGVALIQVLEFVKHQNPHKNEPESTLPPPPDLIGTKPEEISSARADCGFLIPDSGLLIADCPPAAEKAAPDNLKTKLPEDFAPDAAGIAACEKFSLNLAEELGKFRNHHEAHGTILPNWQAGFRTWLDKAKQFKKTSPADNRSVTVPGSKERDPALVKLDADAKKAAKPPQEVREFIAERIGRQGAH